MVEYYEGVERRELENPWLRWPLIVSGIVIFLLGFDLWTQKDELWRGLSWIAMGFGMGFYGVTLIFLRHSEWQRIALVVGLTAWFVGLFGILRFTL
jgi:hypothetical protein